MKTHDIKNQFNTIQRVTVATLNIVLTILHNACDWDLDGLKDFESRYTTMARLARAKDRNTLQGINETRERTDIHLNIAEDVEDTPENRLIEETWRQCFFVALTVLKINNSKEALWNVADMFGDYMDAITDLDTGDTQEVKDERKQAAIDLMNETMKLMGRQTV